MYKYTMLSSTLAHTCYPVTYVYPIVGTKQNDLAIDDLCFFIIHYYECTRPHHTGA
jgi:hypothetical protein